MDKLILKIIIIIFITQGIRGQDKLPPLMKDLFIKKNQARSIVVNTSDTSYTFHKHRIDTNISKHEYYCTINNEKRYFYTKGDYFIDHEYLIYDTVAYWRAGERCLKYRPEELMPYFSRISNFYIGSVKDTFYYKLEDTITQYKENRVEFKLKRAMFGDTFNAIVNYYFDKNSKIKRETNFNNAGVEQKHFTTFKCIKWEKRTNQVILKKIKQIYLEFSELEKNQDTTILAEVSRLWVKNDTLPTYTKEHISNMGNKVSIDSLIEKHKLNILYFSYAGCKPCRILKPYLDTFLFKYESFGLNIIGFNNIDSKAYVDSLHTKYPTYFHSKNLDEELEIQLYPMLILIDNKHKVLAKMRGVNSPSLVELEKFIQSVLVQ